MPTSWLCASHLVASREERVTSNYIPTAASITQWHAIQKRWNIIALHQHFIHRFGPISMSNTVTLSKFYLQWPLGTFTQAKKTPLYISSSHILIPFALSIQMPPRWGGRGAEGLEAFRANQIKAHRTTGADPVKDMRVHMYV
jgi:hypothetical protein